MLKNIIKKKSIRERSNFDLRYFAPMLCGEKEREELVRRHKEGIYIIDPIERHFPGRDI